MRQTTWLKRAVGAAVALTLLAFLFPTGLRAATAATTQKTFSSPEGCGRRHGRCTSQGPAERRHDDRRAGVRRLAALR
jgi:hypothetical protein